MSPNTSNIDYSIRTSINPLTTLNPKTGESEKGIIRRISSRLSKALMEQSKSVNTNNTKPATTEETNSSSRKTSLAILLRKSSIGKNIFKGATESSRPRSKSAPAALQKSKEVAPLTKADYIERAIKEINIYYGKNYGDINSPHYKNAISELKEDLNKMNFSELQSFYNVERLAKGIARDEPEVVKIRQRIENELFTGKEKEEQHEIRKQMPTSEDPDKLRPTKIDSPEVSAMKEYLVLKSFRDELAELMFKTYKTIDSRKIEDDDKKYIEIKGKVNQLSLEAVTDKLKQFK